MIRVPARPASGRLLAGKRTADPCVLFAVEGALLQLFCSVNGFANNQFATGLGATDLQIGLIQTVPNVAALILLLPLGILADRLRSSRTIPLLSLLCVAAGFVLMSMGVPGSRRSSSPWPLPWADRRCTTPSGRTFLATWSAPTPGTGC